MTSQLFFKQGNTATKRVIYSSNNLGAENDTVSMKGVIELLSHGNCPKVTKTVAGSDICFKRSSIKPIKDFIVANEATGLMRISLTKVGNNFATGQTEGNEINFESSDFMEWYNLGNELTF